MFDDIPEDNREGYPCPMCENGSVELNMAGTYWVCSDCDFKAINKNSDNYIKEG
jgi:ribosomal protein L37AE/L43A